VLATSSQQEDGALTAFTSWPEVIAIQLEHFYQESQYTTKARCHYVGLAAVLIDAYACERTLME